MSIAKRPNGKYRARYRDAEGKEHAAHFDRKLDAQRWLDRQRGEVVQGTWVDPAAGRRRFRSYVEDWQKIQVHRPTTAAQVDSHLRNHVLPAFGDRPIGSIRASEVQAWVKGLGGHLKPSTVEVVYRYLVAIFRAAVADKVIAESPCRGVKLPRQEPRRIEPLAVEVVQAITEAMPDKYRALVTLAAGTGLRQGEAFGLTVDRVDFLRRTVKVDRQLVLLPGAAPEHAPPKTQASYRTVPLPAVVVNALAAHLAAYPVGESGLIFTNDQGDPISRTRFSDQVWRPALKRAGLEGAKFHDLRHFYASLLIRHGESVKVVQSRLGHASACRAPR
ncbi:MAG TPA: site-specific integrase [Acidimicrobiales bacterium]|nr:site-specific integrase [Acidimicrobiales bacterium]